MASTTKIVQQGDTILQNLQNPDIHALKAVISSLKNNVKVLSDLNDNIMGNPDMDVDSIEHYKLDFDESLIKIATAISRFQRFCDFKAPVQNTTTNTGDYHLPHHHVFKDSTTPLRIIYDCSRKLSMVHCNLCQKGNKRTADERTTTLALVSTSIIPSEEVFFVAPEDS